MERTCNKIKSNRFSHLLGTEIAGEWNFSVFVNDLLVRVELGDEVAAVVAFVTLHRLGFQVACTGERLNQ